VQLEYHHDGDWQPVVRYDHDAEGSDEGLHVEIYRDGEKHATEYIAWAPSGATALTMAEDHLAENLQRFISRYERWRGIDSR
jgi:hypothetical protein